MRREAVLICLAVAAACSVGPDYVRPTAPVSSTYKELGEWKRAEPRDDLAHGPWWERYDDEELSRLEQQVTAANQDRAAVGESRDNVRVGVHDEPVRDADRGELGGRRLGAHPAERRVERGERAGERRRPGGDAALAAGDARERLLPAARTRRPEPALR